MTWTPVTPQPCELGESPFWHPDEQRLYWVDIPARQLHRAQLNPAGRMDRVDSWAMASEPGCIAPARANGAASGLVIALRDGIYRAPQWGGALQPIVPADHDPATTRFNDGKADPRGRFWAGTIYEPRDARQAKLYALDALEGQQGGTPQLQAMAGDATVGNGLAWSPDAATVYWSDTSAHTIRAWDWDADRNQLSRERVFKQWPGKPAGWQPDLPGYGGRPDGAAVDAQGNYYVAMFEGARVLKLSPAGDVLADIAVPAQCPTMPCFGGPDLKTLYLTTARHNRPATELQSYPDSGCVFSMRVEVPGLPVNFFRA